MTPVSLNGCFAWLHLPTGEVRNAAIVLCPGIKIDEITGYTSLRLLAIALAEQGYPVLRLHYSGVGNSADIAGDEFWPAWQADISHAVDWIRAETGVEQVILCGVRLGGMLAALVASQRTDIAGLILLAPVLRGTTYLRQLQSDGFVNVGARFSDRCLATIEAMDLRNVVPSPNCKMIMFAQSASSKLVTGCVDNWRASGFEVTVADFTGLEAILRPTFANHEAPAAVGSIVTWTCGSFPAFAKRKLNTQYPLAEIKIPAGRETPVFFGEDDHLFGILCRPTHAVSPVVVILANSSADPHCSGITVGLARALAAKGVASLRLDFRGVGDSASPTALCSHVFETDRTADFSAAIDALERLGYQQFATEGLCSGAFHAYYGAMADARIGYALLINLPFFEWVPGFKVEDLVFHARKPSQLWREMQSKLFWLRLFDRIRKGDIRVVLNRFTWVERRLRKVPGFGRTTPTHLSARVKLLFLVSEGDVSGDVLKHEFGSRRLSPDLKIELIEGLDHSMQRRNMCAVVAHHMATFLDGDRSLAITNQVETHVKQPVLANLKAL